MRRWRVLIGLVVIGASCGGSAAARSAQSITAAADAENPTPTATTVKSLVEVEQNTVGPLLEGTTTESLTESGEQPESAILPLGWDEAVASGDIETIRSWYRHNTGAEAYHRTTQGTTTVDMGELERVDRLKITEDNTVVEGKYITGGVVIQASNVTIRGSVIDINGGYGYGVKATDPSASGWTVEYVSFVNSVHAESGSYEHRGNRAILASQPGTARFNQVLDGYGSGLRSEGSSDQIWEYNYVDRIVTSPDSHNTSFALRSNTGGGAVHNIVVRRNLLLDGTSAALSFYPRSAEVHTNILFEENVFDVYYADERGVNYCVNKGSDHGDNVYRWENVRWIKNVFGQTQDAKCGTSEASSGSSATEFTGNRFLDGTPIG